jgi:formiminoglutamate deiminase
MYELAGKLDPESIYILSRMAYAELAMAGVTAVGEFHYVQHGPDGTPYNDRVVMADAVVRAARDVGLRITLLRVLYHRAGPDEPAEGAQRRFSDPTVEAALADADTLAKRFAADSGVRVGVAPHSVRAVPRAWLSDAVGFARDRAIPLHMHVSEQPRELAESEAEHGLTPVALLAEDGILGSNFTAVHATHLRAGEARALGDAGSSVCICRTTERDLGDGLPNSAALLEAGVHLCTGADSHAVSDPFEEARAIELDDRSRAQARHVACEAPTLLLAATRWGYEAIGMGELWKKDRVELDAADPAFSGTGEPYLVDGILFAAGPRAVRTVRVGDRTIITDGRHAQLDPIRASYETTLRSLFAD